MLASIQKAFAPSADAGDAAQEAISADMGLAMMRYMPLRGLVSFSPDKVTDDTLKQLLDALNG